MSKMAAIIEQVWEQHKKVILDSPTIRVEPSLSIYMGEDIWRELKASIRGEQPYPQSIEFLENDTIFGHHVYRVINSDTHFKIFNNGVR